jgi:hypothetical protein
MGGDALMRSAAKRKRVSDAEIDRAIAAAAALDPKATRIVEASYDRASDKVVVNLSNGASFSVRRTSLPRFSDVDPEKITEVEIEPTGKAIWFSRPDIGFRLETLIVTAVGSALIGTSAQAMGAVRTKLKASAARKNGSKGGRPMSMSGFVGAIGREMEGGDEPRASVSLRRDREGSVVSALLSSGNLRMRLSIESSKDVAVKRSWIPRGVSIEPRTAATARKLAAEILKERP